MKGFVIIPLVVLLLASLGCETKQKGPSNLTVGKSKLIDSGNALEAVIHLEKAEEEEVNKLEPRALLLIAYSYGLSTRDANAGGDEAKFKNQREQRIEQLTEAEMKHILQVLSKPSQVRKAGLQALVDKGYDAGVLILDSLAKGRYPSLHTDFTQMLVDMGPIGLDLTLAKLTDETTSSALKGKLVQVLADIGDAKAVDALKSVQSETTTAPGLRMQINTTLYQLGEESYKRDIITGISHSDVTVRRAAAKAMVNIKGISPKTLIAGLKDEDSEVVTSLVEALEVHRDAAATDVLMDILTGELNKDPKQAAINTLDVYGQNKLARGLAKRATMLLIGGTVSDPDNRYYLVQLLRREPFKKQIKALKTIEDLGSKLHAYHEKKEQEDLVKIPLAQLLNEVQ
ncbi:HEAT repeat domain-containing protein [Candidatus Poribacteria bacterium]|nr:HEAT repeat domain-containing protein [Candidatus Poribacteria bacterium]MYB01699.1 HEAT repeat domain-containing protein [Candidatus Poribacteria bacterium]